MNVELRSNDILAGRGKGVASHSGNVIFREIIDRHYVEYHGTKSNKSKRNVTQKVTKGVKDIMHEAARKGNVEVMKLYVDTLGFDPNTKGRQGFTALHFAARSGKTNIVRWLLMEYSGSVAVEQNMGDDRGKTALDLAVANKKQDCIDLLSSTNSQAA